MSVKAKAAFSVAHSWRTLANTKGVTRRAKLAHTLASLERSLGTKLAPDVAAFVEFHLAYKVKDQLGLWHIRPQPSFLEGPQDFAGFVGHGAPFVAATTRTIAIGKDGSGSQFFAQAHPTRSEVFIHDAGSGKLSLLADSLATFVELNDLMASWNRIADKYDIDIEELDDGAVEISPALQQLLDEQGRRARLLLGRVNCKSGSDYDETLLILSSTKRAPKLTSTSDIVDRYKAMKWLMMVFVCKTLGSNKGELAARLEVGRKKNSTMTKDPLYGLWHTFLFHPTDLAEAVNRVDDDPAPLLLATARIMARANVKKQAPVDRLDALLSTLRKSR
jgi:hypothetical protein